MAGTCLPCERPMLGKSRRTDSSTDRTVFTAWLMLVATLPVDEPTARMKILRTLETLGAVPLRDGVYLLPANEANRAGMDRLSLYIRSAQGSAHVIAFSSADAGQEASFRDLFDRAIRYDVVIRTLEALRIGVGATDPQSLGSVVKRQREALEAIIAVDFFESEARARAVQLADELERDVERLRFDTPAAVPTRRNRREFFRKRWVTRGPLLPDRLAASWLIRRFIDAEAEVTVVSRSAPLPNEAVTFGFAGAQFDATAEHSAYEVLVSHFKLERDTALVRVGTALRALDAGSGTVPEAAGFYTMLEGARRRSKDNPELIAEAEKIFDIVYERYLGAQAAA